MKSAIFVACALTLGSVSSLAQVSSAAPVPAPATKPVGYKELKENCLKENPSLKGKELYKCVKLKRQAAH